MAKIRAVIKSGTIEKASRISNSSDLNVELNGWIIGVKVSAQIVDGKIKFTVYKTGGSSSNDETKLIDIS